MCNFLIIYASFWKKPGRHGALKVSLIVWLCCHCCARNYLRCFVPAEEAVWHIFDPDLFAHFLLVKIVLSDELDENGAGKWSDQIIFWIIPILLSNTKGILYFSMTLSRTPCSVKSLPLKASLWNQIYSGLNLAFYGDKNPHGQTFSSGHVNL